MCYLLDVAPYRSGEGHRRFSETWGGFYQATRQYVVEDSPLYSHSCENLEANIECLKTK
jgi:hypothetical protein